jgi:two-component system OmpR family sensor kinase
MRILIRNLVSNAVKFSRRDGRVTITTGSDPSGVFVRVKDEGVGISRGAMEHIFDPFYQADGSSTRAHGGAGVGLSVAKNLATMHGGTLTAASEAGVGSTFTVAIPRAATGPE